MREGTMPSATKSNSSSSSEEDNNGELRRGPWTLEEDTLLIHYIAKQGEGRWNLLAKRSGLKRTGKSCRLRWLNYLKPDVKRGNLTTHEQLLILDLHSKWGNKWSKIAKHLPGRTDNEIKNYWRTRVQKQAKHLKIDANSIAFQDIIRCIWMPRLLQKIENVNSSSYSHPTISSTPLNSSSQLPPPPPPQQPPPPPPPPPQQVSQLSFDTVDTISNYTSNVEDCNYIDYDMEEINLTAMSSSSELFEYPIGFCNVSENDWAGYGCGDAIWSMDGLWGCRSLQ